MKYSFGFSKENLDILSRYLLKWMLGDFYRDDLISYGGNGGTPVRIIPSRFFESPRLPEQDLPVLDGMPVLFGNNEIEFTDGHWNISADFIASAFFMLSRVEEFFTDKRDVNHRFEGVSSTAFRYGFITRPLLDEYALFLRRFVAEKCGMEYHAPRGISRLLLTHDIDMPWLPRYLKIRFFIVKTLKQLLKRPSGVPALARKLLDPNEDYFSFPWILEHDTRILDRLGSRYCEIIFFLLHSRRSSKDNRYLHTRRGRRLLAMLRDAGATLGLHTSFAAGCNSELVVPEAKALRAMTGLPLTCNRNHILCLRDPLDLIRLEEAGVTDDYSAAYADVAGFRLGTSRPVRRIHPLTGEVGSLILHPLTIMECSLDRYMGLNFDQAYEYCKTLIDHAAAVGGEVSLLWHNTMLTGTKDCWQRELYVKVCDYAVSKVPQQGDHE